MDLRLRAPAKAFHKHLDRSSGDFQSTKTSDFAYFSADRRLEPVLAQGILIVVRTIQALYHSGCTDVRVKQGWMLRHETSQMEKAVR